MDNTITKEAKEILQKNNDILIISEMTRVSKILEEKNIKLKLNYNASNEQFGILSKKADGIWSAQQYCDIDNLLSEIYITVGFLLNKKNRYACAITEAAFDQLKKENAVIKPMLDILKKFNSLPIFAGHTIYVDADINSTYKLIMDGSVFSSSLKEKELLSEIYASIVGFVLKL